MGKSRVDNKTAFRVKGIDLNAIASSSHTQNTDTKLAEGTGDEVSANEIRVFIDSKGQNDGLAELDNNGKVPTSQLPLSVQGGIKVIGFWNANTNTPNLSALTLNQGEAYQVSVAGTTNLNGMGSWDVRDLAVWDDNLVGNYFKIDSTDDVLSVNSQTGAVVLDTDDISEGSTNKYNATHTGEVTGATALTAQPTLISNKSLLAVPVGTEEVLVNDAGTLKKILVSSLGSSGKLAIYDSNGVPTFYSTLTSAFTAATSGQTIHFLTSLTETLTTALTIPFGVNVNLNGNTLTFAQPNANSSIETSASVGYVGQFINGTVTRSSGSGIIFSVLNTASDVQIDFSGLVTKDYSGGQHFVSAKAETEPKFKNLTCIATTNNPVSGATVVENFTVKTTSGYCFENITAIKCTASTTSGRCYSSATTINSIGYSTSGTVYFSSNCYNSFGSSSSGIAFRDCTTVSCYGYSNSSWANYLGIKVELSKMYSVSNNAISGNPEISNSLLISDSSYPLNVGNGCKINNNRIICNWNSSAARGIIMGTGCEISHNTIRMANVSSYGIAFGAGESSYGTLNSAAGCAGVYHPGHTQLTVNVADAQGNILSF